MVGGVGRARPAAGDLRPLCGEHQLGDDAGVATALRVFETILTWGDTGDLRRHLERDGFTVDERGRILAAGAVAELPLSGLRDPSTILEHLARMARSSDSDPALAISQARAVVEATTKLVLLELSQPFNEKDDVPALVQAVQKALKLHPETLAPTAPGVQIVKRMLSNLSQLAIGLAELRNEYGPDHGRSRPAIRLTPRHAHLAVGSATTYCRMLLETLDARRQEGDA